ncbi:MAG: hypothetical protein QOI58_1579 [Thermoanaerobaculia bacterium]|jgi:hypothetical protein|nr:hypothetical protein [Thermoanaerobaculia bacterium]
MQLPTFILTGLTPLVVGYVPPHDGRRSSRPQRLPVVVPCQEDTLWCWAAVATGIARFYNNYTAEQYIVASTVLGLQCLPNGGNLNCHQEGALTDALCANDNLWSSFSGSGSIAFVARSIAANRPICVRMEDSNKAGHFVVLLGHSADFTQVYIDDPSNGSSIKPFDQFVKSYLGIYFWQYTYETKSRHEPPHCKFTREESQC